MKKNRELLILFAILLLGAFLRVYKLDTIPPGLNQDEISIGYNANSILHTGKDEYGVSFPLFFRSLDDYKLPGYIYVTAGSIALFGKNTFAIRFPSAFFGAATILVLYFFAKELVGKNKRFGFFPLLSAFLLAVSPWHLQFSRVAFESVTALFFFLGGCFFAALFYRKEKIFFILLSMLLFAVSAYTYHVYRVITPLTILLFGGIFLRSSLRSKRLLAGSVLVFFLLASPMLISLFSSQGQVRFSQTSAFTQAADKPLLTKILRYPTIYIQNYISYFSPYFLFAYGDRDGQHQVPTTAPLPRWEFSLLLLGIYFLLFSRERKLQYSIFGLLVLSVIGGAFASPSPQTLRALPLVIPLTLLVSLGICFFIQKFSTKKWIVIFVLSSVCAFDFLSYLHLYYCSYPQTNRMDWGGIAENVVEKTIQTQRIYHPQKIIVDGNIGFPAVEFPFYSNDTIKKPRYVSSPWQKEKNYANTLFIKKVGNSIQYQRL